MSQSEPVKLALIGCGNRGVNALGVTMRDLPAIDLVAVSDVDEARMEAAAEQLGTDAEGDLARLLARDELQGVVVATSARWHVPVALEAVRAGKHILVEKPLADNAGVARELAQAVQLAGLVGMVGYQLRFSSFAEQLKAEVQAVDPLQALVTRQRGPFRQQFFFPEHYGGIMDHLTHDIHLALWVMGGRPQSVYGSVTRGAILGDQTIELVNAIVEFEGGRTATLVGSMHGIQTPNVVQVVGRRGTVTTFDRKTLRVVRHGGITAPIPATPEGLETRQVETAGERAPGRAGQGQAGRTGQGQAAGDPTATMLEHFADLIAGRVTAQRGATLAEGADAVAVTQAAVEATRTGCRVQLSTLP